MGEYAEATLQREASWAGVKAGEWGRKPLLLIGFSVLPIRGILYTLTSSAPLLVGIQVLDGIGAGIFGVVSVLVIGAALSQAIAGGLVHHFGYREGLLFLAAVALAALVILYFRMPETLEPRDTPPALAPG